LPKVKKEELAFPQNRETNREGYPFLPYLVPRKVGRGE
jgi:hypothetical protein